MNPSGSTRPVMDVSAPRQQSQAPAAAPDQIAVRPAPLATETPKASSPQPTQIAPTPRSTTSHEVARPRSGAPVGIITVAVLVMMLLSAAAVIVYATSQTA